SPSHSPSLSGSRGSRAAAASRSPGSLQRSVHRPSTSPENSSTVTAAATGRRRVMRFVPPRSEVRGQKSEVRGQRSATYGLLVFTALCLLTSDLWFRGHRLIAVRVVVAVLVALAGHAVDDRAKYADAQRRQALGGGVHARRLAEVAQQRHDHRVRVLADLQ